MSIAQQIRQARESQALTLEEVAERIGVEAASVSRWENGKNVPRAKHRRALSKALKIPLSDLTNGKKRG